MRSGAEYVAGRRLPLSDAPGISHVKGVDATMSQEDAYQGGRYLYAVTADSRDRTYGTIGINGGKVYTISHGQVAAVVSDVPNKRIRPERRHLAAHQGVLKRLMAECTVLPMSFGIIADGPDDVRGILSLKQEALLDQLRRVEGKVEMGLRVRWDVPNIFEYFVNTHPDLAAARDRVFVAGRGPSQEEKIELGRLFDRILEEDRAAHAEQVMEALGPSCTEFVQCTLRNEREVMNLACLIPRERQGEFEQAVLRAANLFDNNYCFDYNGPWAPHNFVEVDLVGTTA